MEKYPKIFLDHILESIEAAEGYACGVSFEEFLKSLKDQDAVIRRIEIIGEAVKNLPETLKNKYTDIPWRKIAGMRDVLVHEYFDLDIKTTWDTVQNDLPEFKKQIQKILNEL
ncbi:MAG TPA: DUF86 domain-containing protein [Candidatus Paceibacterota bacterium]|nr:DUF86 domain-containing protein [Candidatus Paceibacterota bacterium]